MRTSNLFLRLSASMLIAVGTLFTVVASWAIPFPVQLVAIGVGLITTGLVLLLSTRVRRSTAILSVVLLWSLVVNVCLACKLGEASSFGAR